MHLSSTGVRHTFRAKRPTGNRTAGPLARRRKNRLPPRLTTGILTPHRPVPEPVVACGALATSTGALVRAPPRTIAVRDERSPAEAVTEAALPGLHHAPGRPGSTKTWFSPTLMLVDDERAIGITPPVAPAGVVAVQVTCHVDVAVTSNFSPG